MWPLHDPDSLATGRGFTWVRFCGAPHGIGKGAEARVSVLARVSRAA